MRQSILSIFRSIWCPSRSPGRRNPSTKSMESLVANYGSSDEEDGGQRREQKKLRYPPPRPPSSSISPSIPPPKTSRGPSALFSSLPRPKISSSSSSIFSSPPPSSSSSSFFSSLPPPKPQTSKPFHSKPPIDFEDEDEVSQKRKKQTLDFSSKPLSSIIPAPKNTLGLAPSSSSASARRSVIETASPAINFEPPAPDQATASAAVNAQGDYVQYDSTASTYGGNYDGSYGVYENYGNRGGDWGYGAAGTEPIESAAILGRRGRKEIPSEIIEVTQADLVKNRPREDQVKLTGIAFGPAYQPAASSEKGKPSKLHKRKHQIGALYYDMRQKESELAERRARGLLTKKETQAKYGW